MNTNTDKTVRCQAIANMKRREPEVAGVAFAPGSIGGANVSAFVKDAEGNVLFTLEGPASEMETVALNMLAAVAQARGLVATPATTDAVWTYYAVEGNNIRFVLGQCDAPGRRDFLSGDGPRARRFWTLDGVEVGTPPADSWTLLSYSAFSTVAAALLACQDGLYVLKVRS